MKGGVGGVNTPAKSQSKHTSHTQQGTHSAPLRLLPAMRPKRVRRHSLPPSQQTAVSALASQTETQGACPSVCLRSRKVNEAPRQILGLFLDVHHFALNHKTFISKSNLIIIEHSSWGNLAVINNAKRALNQLTPHDRGILQNGRM